MAVVSPVLMLTIAGYCCGCALATTGDFGLKTTGHKWSADEYHTLSTLQQEQQRQHDDRQPPVADEGTATETAAGPEAAAVYPALITADTSPSPPPPPSPPLMSRNRYVVGYRAPIGYQHQGGGGGRSVANYYHHRDNDVVDDRMQPEYSMSAATPVWNSRYGDKVGDSYYLFCGDIYFVHMSDARTM